MTRDILPAFALAAGLLAGAGNASAGSAPEDVTRFERFARQAGPFCAQASSRACFERAWTFADLDRDGLLSLPEAQRMHALVRNWTLQHRAELAEPDRRGLAVGLLVVQMVGLDELFRSYDADRDGRLTKPELLADVRLDERPLPVLSRDPKAVNWASLQARLGPAAMLLGDLIPKA